jgi:hypothetical protein
VFSFFEFAWMTSGHSKLLQASCQRIDRAKDAGMADPTVTKFGI